MGGVGAAAKQLLDHCGRGSGGDGFISFCFYAPSRDDCLFVDLITQMWNMQPALLWWEYIFILAFLYF